MLSKLNRSQVESISKFFSDLAKILFGSAVVGFLIPGFSGNVTAFVFITGALSSVGLFLLSVIILKNEE